jgi:hypothetical protein
MANHSRRLDRLEERYAPADLPARRHRIIGDTEIELNRQMNELIALGQASSNDGFVRRLIVSPRPQ